MLRFVLLFIRVSSSQNVLLVMGKLYAKQTFEYFKATFKMT